MFATNYATELGWLPRSRAIRLGWPWVEGRTDDPWDVEAGVPPLEVGDPAPRPDNIVNVDEVEHDPTSPGVETASLATDERSKQAGLHWERLDPGRRGSPPHCHSEEEEVFVILDGACTLELWPSPVLASRGVQYSEVALRPGHVVSRKPLEIASSGTSSPMRETSRIAAYATAAFSAWYEPRSGIWSVTCPPSDTRTR